MRSLVRQVTRWKAFESTFCGCRNEVKRARITGGESRNAVVSSNGAASIIYRRQFYSRYRPAIVMLTQTARVSASSIAVSIMTVHTIHSHVRLCAVGEKKRNEASKISANISCAENVFQWLMKSVM